MTDLSDRDQQVLRSAQTALEQMAVTLLKKAKEKEVSARISSYAAGWRDACEWAAHEAESRAKALSGQ